VANAVLTGATRARRGVRRGHDAQRVSVDVVGMVTSMRDDDDHGADNDGSRARRLTSDRQAVALRGPTAALLRDTSRAWHMTQSDVVERAVTLYLAVANRGRQGARLRLETLSGGDVHVVEWDLDVLYPVGALADEGP
jgi:hypothetical protein